MVVVDQSRYRYILTKLDGTTPAGSGPILNATSKQFNYHLNAGKTAQVTVNIDNPVADFMLSNDCLIKVYRKQLVSGIWKLLMVGDVIHVEEDGQGNIGTITAVAADPWWRLQKRLVGTALDSLGRGTGFSAFTATGMGDLGTILQFILGIINGVGPTGVQPGTNTTSTNGYIGPVYMQPVGDLFQQIVNTLGGPDFEIQPLEPSGAMPGTIIGQLNTYGPSGGNPGLCTVRPNTIFAYGTKPYTVATYSRILSKDGLANTLYSPAQGFPDFPAAGDGMASAQDATSVSAIGVFQDTVPNDVTSVLLRQELVNEYLAVRKAARQQITFTPTVDCPFDYTVDYNVGDIVVARAFANNTYRYNGNVRIYGVDISLDENDAETVGLTLIPS